MRRKRRHLVEVRDYVSGIHFPATKDEIIEYTRNKGAPNGIIYIMEQLSLKKFKDGMDVIEDLGLHDNETPSRAIPKGITTKKSLQIPNTLPQFDNKSLVMVVGRQDSLLYSAHHGIIKKIGAYKMPTPSYSDREGHFRERSQGSGGIRSGAHLELQDERHIIPAFIKGFRQLLKDKVKNKEYADVYLMAPVQIKKEIKKAIPPGLLQKNIKLIQGNFVREHPIKIIELISKKKRTSRKTPAMSLEAKHIHTQAKQARKVIGS